MKFSILARMAAVIALVSAAPAPDTNALCNVGSSSCDEPSGYGRSYSACDSRHTLHFLDCQEGSACCDNAMGISCGMPGTCEEM